MCNNSFNEENITAQNIKLPTKEVVYNGIDISRYQGNICWDKIDCKSISFIICKATEGDYLVDRKFKDNWSSIDKKIVRGAYHFFRPEISGKAQAILFLNSVNFKTGDMIPIIDVEYVRRYNRMSNKIAVKNLNEMILEIENVLNVHPILYTTAHFWDKYISKEYKHYHHTHLLWLADYRENIQTPKGWDEFTLHQYTNKGRVSGITKHVDLNICKISLNSLLIK